MENATHVSWTTGGLFVPDDEYARFLARGASGTDEADTAATDTTLRRS